MRTVIGPPFSQVSFGLVSAAVAPPSWSALSAPFDQIDTGSNPATYAITAVPAGTTRVLLVGIGQTSWSTAPTINSISMTSDAFISITGVRDLKIWGIDCVANPSVIGQTSVIVTHSGSNNIFYGRFFALSGTSGGPKSVVQDNNGNANASGSYLSAALTTGVAAGNLAFMTGFSFNQQSDFAVSPTESAGAGNTLSSVGWNRGAIVAQTIVSASGSFAYFETFTGNNIPGIAAAVYGA